MIIDSNLSACLNDLSRKDTDRTFCLVGALCAEHEWIAFFARKQLSAQLMLELRQGEEE